MAIDPATKAKILERVAGALDTDAKLGDSILKGQWDYFYSWLKKACADIWDAIKDFARNIWNWVCDLFV